MNTIVMYYMFADRPSYYFTIKLYYEGRFRGNKEVVYHKISTNDQRRRARLGF